MEDGLKKKDKIIEELEDKIDTLETSEVVKAVKFENKELESTARVLLGERDNFNFEVKTLRAEKASLEHDFKATLDTIDRLKHQHNKLLATHALTMFELDRKYQMEHGDTGKYNRVFGAIMGGAGGLQSPLKSPARRRRQERGDSDKLKLSGVKDSAPESGTKLGSLIPGLKLNISAVSDEKTDRSGPNTLRNDIIDENPTPMSDRETANAVNLGGHTHGRTSNRK